MSDVTLARAATGLDQPGPDGDVEVTVPTGEAQQSAARLLELAVADLALIDRLRLAFEPGLNVLTGETGAGKSLVIDALGLALGARSDLSLVRHGADTARVEALFDRLPEPLIAVRELSVSGRSTARLDDATVTAARLAETIGPLVEIHGQHDQSRLLDERWQLELLDSFGGHAELRAAVAGAVARWRDNRTALAELAADPREIARRIEILTHEVEEIGAARLRPGEAGELRARLEAARHGEAIARATAAIRALLDGGEDGGPGLAAGADAAGIGSGPSSGRDAIGDAVREARALARLDARFGAIAERLAGLEAEIADAAGDVRLLAASVDHDAAAISAMGERLSAIYALTRRYGDDEAEVLAHAERAAAELERLSSLDEERARREADDARLLLDVATAAAQLSSRRSAAAAQLAGAVDGALQRLGFRAGAFDVSLGRRFAGRDEPAIELDGDAVAFDATGADELVFRFAPNVGEPSRPLAKVASGGELSRVALAIKQVLAEADATPTLVFDEIDAGIGARTADPVGRSLWALARNHQVLVVTHIAQIAAHADAHFRIVKRERGGRTVTEVERLDREGRITELAAMLGAGSPPGEPRDTARGAGKLADGGAGGPGDGGAGGPADGPADGPALAPSLVASARALLEAAEAAHARAGVRVS